ncbi:GspE/PulE family protein [Halarsenatibacter silvermanii]|uniref:GspE/PulE family protein n=1 Tax=Halarsenatibacter silvermanii TaxID=321763 RepID=UPI000B7CE2A0|nr:GspE/PulE family protein [Halarsenatibacter silvermanii]
MAPRSIKKIGEMLIDFDYISKEELKEAVRLKNNSSEDKKIGEVMVDLGYISEKELLQVLEMQMGIPIAELSDYYLDPGLADYLPENIARRHLAVPLQRDGELLLVAMSDPTDLIAIDDIERVSGLNVKPHISSPGELRRALDWIYTEDSIDIGKFLEDFEQQEEEDYAEDELREMVEEAPIVRLANTIISRAYQRGASDIHVEPEEEYIRIRYRIDGVLREEMKAPKSSQRALVSRFKIIADLDITEHRVPQDGKIQMSVKGYKIDMRVSTLPTVHGEKVVIRILTRDSELLDLENLGFSKDNLEVLKKLIKKPHGILLLTGPTGSGKSTTLFASINEINEDSLNVVTIEDPVEYQLEGVYQVQARPKAGLTFARTLRSILRQDPDIIMIGEMRDSETAEIAVRAALTGHLVFSTLHTNDAISSVTRLVDMGLPSYLVSSSVIGVVAQRLVRRLCPDCRREAELTGEDKAFLAPETVEQAFTSDGCKKCGDTGYSGRLALQEILIMDSEIKELISGQADEEKLKRKALSQGMTTLKEDGVGKLREGLTDVDELKRIIF